MPKINISRGFYIYNLTFKVKTLPWGLYNPRIWNCKIFGWKFMLVQSPHTFWFHSIFIIAGHVGEMTMKYLIIAYILRVFNCFILSIQDMNVSNQCTNCGEKVSASYYVKHNKNR